MTRDTAQIVEGRRDASQRVSDTIVRGDLVNAELDDVAVAVLVRFFTLLDEWDQEANVQ